MRIAQVTNTFQTGGGLEHIYQIARGMPGYEFIIFGKGGEATEALSSLDEVTLVSDTYSLKHILSHQPDVVHVHHLKPLLEIYLGGRGHMNIPLIYTAHGLHIHKYSFFTGLLNQAKKALRFSLEKKLYRAANSVITVSSGDEAYLRKRYDCNHCVCVPNGIDFSQIDKALSNKMSELRTELGLSPDCLIFLTVARFDFQKGYDILLHAIYFLRDKLNYRKNAFVLVGDGETLSEMKALSQRLGVNKFVYFIGRRNDVYQLMKQANFLILPSRWEGLPITLIEAGYCQLAVITSDTWGNNEIIQNRETGLLHDNESAQSLADTILNALDTETDWNSMRENLSGRIRKNYNIHGMIHQLEHIYNSYVGQN